VISQQYDHTAHNGSRIDFVICREPNARQAAYCSSTTSDHPVGSKHKE